MASLFCLVALFSSTSSIPTETTLTSSWNVEYIKLNPYIESIDVFSTNWLLYLNNSDFNGTIESLVDGVYPSKSVWPNVDNDIKYHDNCIAPKELAKYYVNRVLKYTVTFTDSFEIYRADLIFAWDFPSGAGFYVPDINTIYMETDDGTKTYDTAGDYFTYLLPFGFDPDSDIDDDYKAWQSDLPSSQSEALVTSSLSFYIGGPIACMADDALCNFLLCEIDIYGYPQITSSYGVEYIKLHPYMQSVQVYSTNWKHYLNNSDFAPGAIEDLTDEIYPTAIQHHDECIAPIDIDKYYVNSRTLKYTVTFSDTFEIYRADLIFASSAGDYVPDITTVYMETDDGTKIYDTSGDYFTYFFPYKAWQSDLPSTRSEAQVTSTLSFYIGGPIECLADAALCNFLLCEIDVYGYLITASPSYSPTLAPSAAPTYQPTASPSAAPSAPSHAPTQSVCPDFNIKQPCCAAQGGYHYVNYTYNKVTDAIVAEPEVDTACLLALNDSNCCGEHVYSAEVIAHDVLILLCMGLDGFTPIATGESDVCNADFLVDKENATWYGYEAVSGRNVEYSAINFTAQTYKCACDYVINVCEQRKKLTCLNSDAPFETDSDLCGINATNKAQFVGGAETDIIKYEGATYDDAQESCECGYIGDNCLDDLYKRDAFDGALEDNDTCIVKFIQDCCIGSELAFGGQSIAELTLTQYVGLAEDGGNAWQCLNGNAFCDASNIPIYADEAEVFLSWVYNEDNSSDIGFSANSLCKCLIAYDNCSTYNPTVTEIASNTYTLSSTVDSVIQTTEAADDASLIMMSYITYFMILFVVSFLFM